MKIKHLFTNAAIAVVWAVAVPVHAQILGGGAQGGLGGTLGGTLGGDAGGMRGAAQDLRVDRHRHSQHDCDCGAREKMIDLHGRLLSRPRPVRDLSLSTTTGRGEIFRGPGNFRRF